MSSQKSYQIDRILHWISALAILFMLLDMGTRIHNVDYRIKGAIGHKQDAIEIHIAVAFILLLSLICRLVWYHFFLHEEHKLKYESVNHKWLVRIVHTTMYTTLFLFMVSGTLMVTNYEHPLNIFDVIQLSEADTNNLTFNMANSWHLYFESIIYFLILVHFIGALYNRR
ncbi:MAG: cytochrome b/b6 domain-containing protein [Pseudomonadota bacterium]|nr:cytochrome b/b6 domain-containing protein [Pseudomonadota bacterium]